MRSSIVLAGPRWVALACLLVAGCLGGWDDYRDGAEASGSGGAGGTGQMTGAGAGGGGGGDAAPGRCGGVDVFADDFSMNNPEAPLWEIDGDISMVSGELVIKPAVASMDYSWNSLISRHYFDLRGGAISIEVKSMVNTASGAVAIFRATLDGDNYVAVRQSEGVLRFAKSIGGQDVEVGRTPYDANAHRYWRMREDGGTLYWETSSDSVSWTLQGSSSSLFDLSSVRVQLVGAVDAGEPEPGEAHFDNLNGGGVPQGKWCKPSVLKDDFDDGAIGQGFARSSFDSACQHAESGELVFTLPAGGKGACYYRSASAFDLTGATLSVKVPATPNPMTDGEVVFEAIVDGDIDRALQFYWWRGHLLFRHVVDKTVQVIDDVPFVPGEHLFWRFREDAGEIFWETSADGQTWKISARAKNPFPVAALDIGLTLASWSLEDAPVEVHFDQLNMP